MMKYKDKNLSPEERASDLLSRMTLDEKLLQISFSSTVERLKDEIEQTGKYTPCYGTFHLPPDVNLVKVFQDYAINNTRLGIPLMMNCEALHGVCNARGQANDPHCTVFPQCLGLGCSFNPENVQKMGEIIGKEARAWGMRQVYAPNVDIPRDPRWGRTQENFGEDPYLTGKMGAAYVRGVQSQGVATTVKHYLAYGVPEGGINIAPAHIGEREIREVMLEPFKECIKAGAMAIMPSYNEVDGDPIHGSKKYMRDILRDELGFDGVTVSDYGAIRMLNDLHFVAATKAEAGKLALEAGIDVEAPWPEGYNEEFRQGLENGDIDMALLDEAVLRILKLKFRLGIFEDPYPQYDKLSEVHSSEAVELALKMDEESILLLENDGILPLDEKKVGKVAVIGNNACPTFMGDYTAGNKHYVDFLAGIENRLGKENVLYARGCNPVTTTDEMIAEAVETAEKADTVFLVLGACAGVGGGVPGEEVEVKNEITDSEGYDLTTLDLLPSQRRLFDAVTALGKPCVFVMYSGRPQTLKEDVKKVNALLYSFGGGEQTGNAMANLIFGDKSPSAKLAISFPNETGSIPCYYNYKYSARGFYKKPGTVEEPGQDYVTCSPDAWYTFGYGLSYTKLNYSNLKAEVLDDKEVSVSVDIENVGDYDICENVLVFIRTMYAPTTPFVKKLRAFKKVDIAKGEKVTVSFTLTPDDFTYIDFDMKKAYATGVQKIMVEDLECEINL